MENGEWESVGVCTCSCGESGIMGVFISSSQHEVQFAGVVYVWEKTDNPAKLHSPAITASTTLQSIKVVVG